MIGADPRVTADVTSPGTTQEQQQQQRSPAGGQGGARRRGDNDVPPRSRTAVPLSRLLRRRRARQVPVVVWEDVRLPLLGRLWATAWLPSILLAGCLVALMYLLQASGVATTGYDIQRLQSERDDWALRNEQLRFELAKRQSLTWIESEATGRLGMVRADPTALTYLQSGQSSR